ncbi:helix-turn-helix domain-containing protein [Micromonospora sp. NPDC023644]|uniref:helix-turn-helix transcriptional regulator n=1 Tax=Micromonospora sp. NPDC023644 TaxID=3154321 RepID=UPI00340476FB
MNAAPTRSDNATPSPVRMRTTVFDQLVDQRWGDVSKTDLARTLGIERTNLYKIRQGKVTPTLETAMRMAEGLGTTVEELFEVTS